MAWERESKPLAKGAPGQKQERVALTDHVQFSDFFSCQLKTLRELLQLILHLGDSIRQHLEAVCWRRGEV